MVDSRPPQAEMNCYVYCTVQENHLYGWVLDPKALAD